MDEGLMDEGLIDEWLMDGGGMDEGLMDEGLMGGWLMYCTSRWCHRGFLEGDVSLWGVHIGIATGAPAHLALTGGRISGAGLLSELSTSRIWGKRHRWAHIRVHS